MSGNYPAGVTDDDIGRDQAPPDDDDLGTVDAVDLVARAHDHLRMAALQVSPSDDQIIIGHMLSALALLDAVVGRS